MNDNRQHRTLILLVSGSCIVLLLVMGIAFFESGKSSASAELIATFNESLIEYNRDAYERGNATTTNDNPTADGLASSRSIDEASDGNGHDSIGSAPDKESGFSNEWSDSIKPFVGDRRVEHENPAFDWLDPQTSVSAIADAAVDKNPDRDLYGWMQLRSDLKASQLQASMREFGAEIVSSTPKYVRVKLPGDRELLDRIASLEGVEGIGVMPPEAKYPPHLFEGFETQAHGTEVPVFITTMADDVDGSMKSELIAMGATVGQWDRDIRTYAANVDRMTLDRVLSADFVEKVSPNTIVRAHLANLTGAMGADVDRTYSDADQSWSGKSGEGATVGVMDTGINTLHRDFSDKSICTRSTVHEDPDYERDARLDAGFHGSHVSGIATSSGKLVPAYAGVAPGVKSLRVAKVLTPGGFGDTLMFFNGVKFHTETDPCSDPATADPAHVINVSLGGYTPETDGTSILSRKMDAASYTYRQNYVISAGNDGRLGGGDTASTKSAMSVGATTDSGVITSFSSHGPTADGRLLPQIVAPGFEVISVAGGGNEEGFSISSGTSMSSPAVAGLAGVFLAANPEFADNPAAVRASLMAAALKPRRWIGSMENMPESNTEGPGDIQAEYGMGFASLVPHDLDGVEHGSVKGEMNSDAMATTTITVPAGTSRLDVVLAFNEPASPALDRTVLSNLDLYLDKGGDCGASACGEYSSKSKIDTVEWLLIKDPEPGIYELKVVPQNAFDAPVLFGASWVMIDDDVPELSITSDTDRVSIESGDRVKVELSIDASGYIANGVTVHAMCRANPVPGEEDEEDMNPCDAYVEESAAWLPGSVSSRGDGTRTSLASDSFSAPVPIGSVTAGSGKDLTLRLSGSVVAEVGSHTLYLVATSWNGKSAYKAVDVIVDGEFTIQGEDEIPPRATAPANDDIDNAIALSGDSGVLQSDLILATREPGEPMLRDSFLVAIVKFPISSVDNINYNDSEDYEYVRNNSVWYKVDAPENPLLLGFGDIPPNVGVNIYKGSAAKSALLADNWNEPFADGADASLFVNLEPEIEYFVQVYAHDEVGDLMIPWVMGTPQPPANDDLSHAKDIEGDLGRVSGTNFKSSLEGFEVYDTTFVFSTWYSWSPENSGVFRFEVDGDALAVVFDGSNSSDLRRISTMPQDLDADHVYAYANADQSYQVVVLSRITQDTLSGYWLEWAKVNVAEDHVSNDMFAMAEEATDLIAIEGVLGRTVEPGEPRGSGIGSRWWKWTAPASGSFTFELDTIDGEMASVFSGSSLDELQLLGQGTTFTVGVEEGTEYHIAVGRTNNEMFLDFIFFFPFDSELIWGPTPANDSRSNATQLSGAADSVSFTHAFATTEASDGLKFGMTHSLWWEWTAAESGWHQIATESTPSQPSFLRDVDSVVILTDGDTGRRLGTSDRSYVLNGNSEITFYADGGKTYVIQTALREAFFAPEYETSLSWGPADAPPYSRFVGRYRSADLNPDLEIASLENPTSIASNEGGGKIFVNGAGGLVVLDAVDVDTMPQLANEVSYVDATGVPAIGLEDALLYWDNTMNALYAVALDAIWLVSGHDTPDGHFVNCAANDSTFDVITDAFTTGDGKFLYVLGLGKLPEGTEPDFFGPFPSYQIAIFSRSDANACGLSHVQTMDMDSVSALETTFSFVVSADSSHVYLAGDDGVTTLARDAMTGELTVVDFDSVFERDGFYTWWRQSEAALAPLSKDHLFITAEDSPTVAVYSLADPANPQMIDSKADYYARVGTDTFETSPLYRFGCRIIGGHATSIAVDFMCRGELLTAELQTSGDLWLMDAMYAFGTDRFGRTLPQVPFAPDGVKTVGVRPLSQNLFILNSGATDSLAVFDHVLQIEGNPRD